MIEKITDLTSNIRLKPIFSPIISNIIGVIIIIILEQIILWISTKLVKPAIVTFIKRYNNTHRHYFYKQKLENSVAHIIAGIFLLLFIPIFIKGSEQLIVRIIDLASIYIVISFAKFMLKIVDAYHDMYKDLTIEYKIPIVGYVQTIKLAIYIISAVFLISIMFGISIGALLGGFGILLGALTFVFKDTILGFIAVIQMTANRMVGIGDWIKVPTYHVDGKVLEISLSTVKVRNWNNVIVMIPTYALVGGSFQNWEEMKRHGWRRIKQRIFIDSHSICELTPTIIKRSRNHKLTRQEVKTIESEIDIKTLTSNLALYRKCIINYLKNYKSTSNKRKPVVRMLAPTELGTPVDIIAYSNKTSGEPFFSTRSDILEYAMVILPVFGLCIYQRMSDS